MNDKRFIAIDDGFDFMVRDIVTGDNLIDADGVADVLNDYEKENEQLKQFNSQFAKVNREGVKKVQKLAKENEQLKKELKRCRDWLNSDKNDYQLTLAFIKNKGYSLKDVLEYEKELKK